MNIKQLIVSAVAFTILGLVPAAAQADPLTFIINNPVQTGSVGDILTFSATVTNPSANAFSLTINGGGSSGFPSPPSATLTLDEQPFFDNFFGNTLTVGQSIPNMPIFTVTIGAGTATGTYKGSFTIFDDSGAPVLPQDFFVIVQGGAGIVPEPASMLLLGTGLAGVVASLRKRRRGRTP